MLRSIPKRYWFPLFVSVVSLAAIGYLWTPSPTRGRDVQIVISTGLVLINTVLWLIWLVLFSRTRWYVRVAVPAVAAAIVAGAWSVTRRIDFTGDMIPKFQFTWDRTEEEILAQHRQKESKDGLVPVVLASADPNQDFPAFRGPLRDGIVHGPRLSPDWKSTPPKLVWKQPVGGGYSAFVIGGNVAVTIEQRGADEAVVAYDRQTGRERWVYQYPALFSEALGGDGPRATPTIADGDIYSLGATGVLARIDGTSGKLKWSTNILTDAGATNVTWAMSGAPLVFEDKVIVNPGGTNGKGMAAYDRETGKPIWFAGNHRAGYSSPMLATLAGKQQILIFDWDGLAAYDPDQPRELWRFDWVQNMGINVSQPIVVPGDHLFISTGYDMGDALVHVECAEGKWSAKEVYRGKAMHCKFTSPVLHGQHLYGLDQGILVCVEANTGKRLWKKGRYGHGQLLLSGDLLVILAEDGTLALVECNPYKLNELARIPAIEGRTWNTPALADGQLYIRNHAQMARFDLPIK